VIREIRVICVRHCNIPPTPLKRGGQGVKSQTYPPAGIHYAPNGGTFTFTLKPLSPGDILQVTTNDANEYITATTNADGTYTASEVVQAVLPAGVYIVAANGRTYKTVISE
jgi:hypothetical protein